MKYYTKILLLLLSLVLISCTQRVSKYDYRQGADGLIYERDTEKLYTGRIIDTIEVIIEYDVVDGKKNGEFITYYLNGNVEKQGQIKDNKNTGQWNYYYESGSIESTGKFENNEADGQWVFYYENGNKMEEGKFKKGQRVGKWTSYNEEGEVINESDFDLDKESLKKSPKQSPSITSL